MKNVELIGKECMKDLDKIGIPYNKNTIRFSKFNAQRLWGQCRRYNGTEYEIRISSKLLKDEIPIEAVKKVMYHELLHTCKDCMCHTGVWKKYAAIVKNKLGYDITRTDSDTSLGIEGMITRQYKYIVTCDQCGATWKRYKKSALISNVNQYHCQCGGKLHCSEVG